MDVFSDPTPIATTGQFKTALLQVRDRYGIPPKHLEMLKAHCLAPSHTISTSGLAEKVGYSSFSSVNMQYGTFARHVAEALHVRLPPTPTGDSHWWRALAYGNDGVPQTDDGRYEWIMRPELVQALQEMRWVKP